MMKLIVILLCSLALLGCANMSPQEKRTAWIATGIVVGAIIISSSSNPEATRPCKPSFTGSGANFDYYCRPQ